VLEGGVGCRLGTPLGLLLALVFEKVFKFECSARLLGASRRDFEVWGVFVTAASSWGDFLDVSTLRSSEDSRVLNSLLLKNVYNLKGWIGLDKN